LFSSRTRHTRFSRDWSSDVCSSDLTGWGTDPRLTATYLAGKEILTFFVGNLNKSAIVSHLIKGDITFVFMSPTRTKAFVVGAMKIGRAACRERDAISAERVRI